MYQPSKILSMLTVVVCRNKRLSKGKKGLKKRTQDPFTRKDWYSVKVRDQEPNSRLFLSVHRHHQPSRFASRYNVPRSI